MLPYKFYLTWKVLKVIFIKLLMENNSLNGLKYLKTITKIFSYYHRGGLNNFKFTKY